ncbi:tetratricopeptide repeat protein [Rhodovibrionaceae bacterium A322]
MKLLSRQDTFSASGAALGKSSSQSEQLSAREREIAEAFSTGESYLQIAERLCIAPSTVRTHLSTIYRKLGVSSKLELHQCLDASGTTPTIAVSAHTRVSEKPSIAVLAFENMSRDPEQEYFSDGISEDIITALSRSPWLFIIARNTTFTYKDQKVDVKEIAEELGVQFVLEGSVRKAGDRIRVSAQLIDGKSGGHIWSERYDGQLEDVFDLQDEITRKVVASTLTKVHLSAQDNRPEEGRDRSRRPDLTVWELTMRAWHLLYDFNSESYDRAEVYLTRALEHDPDSAEAHMLLSLMKHHRVILGFCDDPAETAVLARDLGRRATRLDPRNEYAHWALGISCFALQGYEEAIAALEQAVELNPNCSVAYGSLGSAYCLVGRVDEAIEKQNIAIQSNPLDPSIFFRFTGMGLAHYQAGRFKEASDWAAKAVYRMPRWYLGHFLLAACHVRMGELSQAQSAIAACREVLPETTVGLLDRMPLRNQAEMEGLRSCLREAGLPD